MRKLLIFTFVCLSFLAQAAITSTTAGGNWNATTTWVGNVVPTSTTDVVIDGPVTVTNNPTCLSLVINATTTLTINSGKTLTVNTFITNNGTISGSAGTLELATSNGTQTISGIGSATIGLVTTLAGGTRDFTQGTWTITALTTSTAKNLSFAGTGTYTIGTINHGGSGTITIGNTGTHTLTNVNISNGGILTISKTPYTVAATDNWNISNGSASFVDFINNSANFAIGASGIMNVTSTLTNNATVSIGGTMNLTGALSNSTASTITLNGTLTTASANITNTNSGDINGAGTLNIQRNFTNSGTINLTNINLTSSNNQAISGGGTTTATTLTTSNSAGTKTISAGTWNITTLNVTAGASLSLTPTVSASFTIATLTHSGTGTVTFANTGTFSLTNVTVSGAGTLTVSKTPFTVTTSETWNISNGTTTFVDLTNNSANFSIGATSTVTISGTLTNNSTGIITNAGTLTVSGLLTNNASGSIVTNGTFNIDDNTASANLNSGSLTGIGSLNIKRNLTNDGTVSMSIVNLTGNNAQSLIGIGTATITTLTTSGNGNKTISNGTWNITGATVSSSGTGDLIFSGGTITISGTITNNGTTNAITFSSPITTLTLNNLTVNTTLGGKITFNKDATIDGTLTLTSGNITLGSNNQLTANTIIGGSSTSYVVPNATPANTGSRLKRDVGTSATTFPIGTSSGYTPITVTFPSANTFTARVSASFANTLPNPEGGIKLEWTFTNGSAVGGTATLGLTWNAGDIGTSFDAMNAQAYRYSSGWAAKGGTVSGNSISVNTTNFSPWAVFSPAALPVELVSFTAIEENGNAKLTWQTVSERNNRGFDIEKSLDARSFYTIGSKDGAGTSEQARVYSFIDDELSDVSYYRLKQVDMDGGFTYSKIAVVVPEGASDELMVSPNPSNHKLKISIKGTIQQVNLLNLNGQLVLSNSSKTIDIADLPDGMYLLQVVTEFGVKTKKVVKQL